MSTTDPKNVGLTPEAITELKAKHGKLHRITASGETVVVKSPGRAEWNQFRQLRNDEKKRTHALEQLVRDCVVHPEPVALDAILSRKPALAEVIGSKLAELAGASDEVEVGEL